ncbi:MAG TPA: nucleotidyltransferase domain-containing protein [Tepidisphaeraceae bacterium]|nr:nucleotidyltransferase domain-containing protein [Tepidisphaeraceae bacterium]
MINLIEDQREAIAGLCRRFDVRRLDLFGSAARSEFDPASSDLDFLVEFADRSFVGASDRYFGLLEGLEFLLHRRVDLVDLAAARNPYFLEEALKDRRPIYAA